MACEMCMYKVNEGIKLRSYLFYCECFNLCPGGCRAKAYMETNDLLGACDEISCSISKEYRAKLVSGQMDHVWEKKDESGLEKL